LHKGNFGERKLGQTLPIHQTFTGQLLVASEIAIEAAAKRFKEHYDYAKHCASKQNFITRNWRSLEMKTWPVSEKLTS